MPTIKFKKEAIDDLKYARLFEYWLINFKYQWNDVAKTSGNGWTVQELENATKASKLIMRGFRWDESDQGIDFWQDAYHELKEMDK